ncbi:MAG: hypothetical protein Sapg2KO_14790 [Saprospiraceae bacterium]
MDLLHKYEARIEEMLLGVRELEQWILDQAQQGFAQLQKEDTAAFEAIAGRLVDLRLGSIARRIRTLERLRQQEDWLPPVRSTLAELYLFTQRFKKIYQLEPLQRLDLLQEGGVNLPKKDILTSEPAIQDYWLILGVEIGAEEKIRYRRTWLWGESQQKAALILDFAWGSEPFPGHYTVGAAIEAKVIYYPAAVPIRALIEAPQEINRPFTKLEGTTSMSAFSLTYAQVLQRAPGTISYPVLLQNMIPFHQEGQFYLSDTDHYYRPLEVASMQAWRLIALSGGEPISLFATWNGSQFKPLSALVNKRVIVLS